MPLRSLSDKRGFLTQVLPAILYAVALFCLGVSHIALNVPQGFVPQDKLTHFGAFGLLVWLAYRAFRFELGTAAVGQLVWLSIAASSSTGALLEIWQSFFPYRSAEFADWVADTLGAMVAGYAAFLWISWRKRQAAARE